jgi:hypothetical protein
MTEGKQLKKGVQLTHSETKERNLLLKKLEKNGDFDRCVYYGVAILFVASLFFLLEF